MADIDDLIKRIDALESEVKELKRGEQMHLLASNRLWDEALSARRGFINVRMQIDDVRRELLSRIDFLDTKFTAIAEGHQRRFDELNEKFDALSRIIAEMIANGKKPEG